ncbi:MAG: protein-tyrosine phosphatase family protein [Miltoncostaeaceae bacterium]
MALTPFRDAWFRGATRLYGPGTKTRPWTWIGDERIAVGSVPTPESLQELAREGVTHVVNCRARLQTHFSQDLSAERQVFGDRNVAVAPMWDHGRHQPPEKWAQAAEIAAGWLDDDPHARVLIHCQRGRRRSLFVAYAVLRLRGRSPEVAARDLLEHRHEARLVPTYRKAVEDWLATGAAPIHQSESMR